MFSKPTPIATPKCPNSQLSCSIKRLVKLLFFRLNQQKYRNTKYKKNLKSNSATARAQPLEERGNSRETALDVDSLLDSVISANGGDSRRPNASPTIPSLSTTSPFAPFPADPSGSRRVGESSTVATSSSIAINDQRRKGDSVDGVAESGDVYSVPLTTPPSPSVSCPLVSFTMSINHP